MQGLCHDRSRRNTSRQVYCIRAVRWPHGFFVCSGGYWEPAAANIRVSAARSPLLAVKTSARPPVQTCRNDAWALAVWEPAGAQRAFIGQRHTIGAAAFDGSFVPELRFEKLEILRSRWRRRSLTDAAMPLAGTQRMSAFSKSRSETKSLAKCPCTMVWRCPVFHMKSV